MIEIEEPPTIRACASCGSVLIWLYSARKSAWVAFVQSAADYAITPHECRHAQHGATWRQLPHGSPPTPDYLAAKAALGKTPAPEETT